MPSDKRPAGISVVQVLASALAAATATVALSYLGATGTILGAALASVITVVGNYVYSRSLRRTHQAVKTLAHQAATLVSPASPVQADAGSDGAAREAPAPEPVGGAADADDAAAAAGSAAEPAEPAEPAAAAKAGDTAELPEVDANSPGDTAELPEPDPNSAGDTAELPEVDANSPGWLSQMIARHGTARTLAALGIVLFLVISAVVTGVELLAGRSLSDIVTGDDSGRTTTFVNREEPAPPPVPSPSAPDEPAPTVTVTITPEPSPVEPTEAPATREPEDPAEPPIEEPTEEPSEELSPEPTEEAEPPPNEESESV
ncbi:MAG: hypothetical protein LBE08_07450 [Bifidobacteriaceae bacterium]|jgi:outer membrane biosynthesis protein TonB|nr:hypothetical protein [Bifidobacteriaceae bacterium]